MKSNDRQKYLGKLCGPGWSFLDSKSKLFVSVDLGEKLAENFSKSPKTKHLSEPQWNRGFHLPFYRHFLFVLVPLLHAPTETPLILCVSLDSDRLAITDCKE